MNEVTIIKPTKMCLICEENPTINKHPNSKYCRQCGNKKKNEATKICQMRDPQVYRAYQKEYQKTYRAKRG